MINSIFILRIWFFHFYEKKIKFPNFSKVKYYFITFLAPFESRLLLKKGDYFKGNNLFSLKSINSFRNNLKNNYKIEHFVQL